jgi:hypothetical protein
VGDLDELEAGGQIALERNERNLGFVRSVNRGMALHPDRDVVLLNSDTEVANDWLDRLQRSALSQPDIGTVTPFSNNATICSYPFECWTGGIRDPRARRAGCALRERQPGTHRGLAHGRGVLHVHPAGLSRRNRLVRRRTLRTRLWRGEPSASARAAGWRSVLAADVFVSTKAR